MVSPHHQSAEAAAVIDPVASECFHRIPEGLPGQHYRLDGERCFQGKGPLDIRSGKQPD